MKDKIKINLGYISIGLLFLLSGITAVLAINRISTNKNGVITANKLESLTIQNRLIKEVYTSLSLFSFNDFPKIVDGKNDTLSLNQVLKNNNTIALLIPELTCSDCIRDYIDVISRNSKKFNFDLIVLAYFVEKDYFSQMCRTDVFGTRLYSVTGNQSFLNSKVPFICVLNLDLRMCNCFVPFGNIAEQLERYLYSISQLMQK
jgi:hypothetical protein